MRTRSLPLLLLALLWAHGCGRKSAPAPSDTYVYLGISDIDTLDPAWAYDTASHGVLQNLYEYLITFEGSSAAQLAPALAERVPTRANGLISADGRVYTFPIRKGVKFHDGSELTPEDVRYSILRFLLFDRDAGPSALLLEPLLGYAGTRHDGIILDKAFADASRAVRVEGDNVVLTLHRPFAPILAALALWAPALSKSWCAAHGEWDGTESTWRAHNNPKKESSYLHRHANGTGPFKLGRWDINAKELVLERFDGYRLGPAKLKRAVTRGVDEFATRKLMLQAGDADSIYADRLALPLLKDLPGVEIIDDLPIIEMNPSVHFTFRLTLEGNPNVGSGKLDGNGIPADFFADLDVRKAFAHALDYEGYIRDIDRGKGSRAAGFIPKGLIGYDESLPKRDFDLAKAAEHLKKARGGEIWEKGFRFTIAYNTGNQPRETIANMLKRNIESLNPKFKIDTRGLQWSTYLDQIQGGKLPVFVFGWVADYPDSHNFAFSFMHSKGHFPGIQRYENAEADALVEAALRELDPAKRAELYGRLQRMAYEEVPSLPILNKVRYRTQRAGLKGFVHNPAWPDAPYSCPLYTLSKEAPGP